jgi:hypothetical protein
MAAGVTGGRIFPMMRMAATVFGVLLVLLGVVWVGQGLGYIKGSFMTGESLWAWIGLGCLLAGLVLLGGAAGFRRRAIRGD